MTTTTFDAVDDPLTVTDAKGVTTTNTYDAHGVLQTSSTPLLDASGSPVLNGTTPVSAVTTYNHATQAHPEDVTSKVDADGNTWAYTYDAARGYMLSAAAPATTDNKENPGVAQTNTTLWAYDPQKGWPSAMVSPRGQLAGVTTSCAPPAVGCTRYAYADTTKPSGYDLRDSATATADPNGHTTRRHLDAEPATSTR